MSYIPGKTEAITPSARTVEMGVIPTRGGNFTADPDDENVLLPYNAVGEQESVFKYLKVRTTAGDIVVRGLDGNPYLQPKAGIGVIMPGAGSAILLAAEINGIDYTTDAEDIHWYGGT